MTNNQKYPSSTFIHYFCLTIRMLNEFVVDSGRAGLVETNYVGITHSYQGRDKKIEYTVSRAKIYSRYCSDS